LIPKNSEAGMILYSSLENAFQVNTTTVKQCLILLIGVASIAIASWCGWQSYRLSQYRAEVKADYSTLNNITYGLLSVNAWRDHVTTIVTNRIETFAFSPAERDTLKVEVEGMLHALVDKAGDMLDEKPKTLGGKIKRVAIKAFVKEDKIHKRVPEFADKIVSEVTKKKHMSRLKFLAQNKLKQAEAITYDSTNDIIQLQAILDKYAVADVASFNEQTKSVRDGVLDKTYFFSYIIIGLLTLSLICWWLLRKQRELHTVMFIVSIGLALVALITGLMTPMIEIDARIKELSFMLIGEKIVFNDQVIFYQSKSIVDVVKVLIETRKIDSVVVGVLILAFSILFPIGKLAATQIYLLGSEKIRNSRAIQYFAFKSGKWSMADVNVVAIFMAYIGFKGILDSQLASVNIKTESLASVSTNETSLQPGFILFVGFVVFSLILSEILHRTLPPPVEKLQG
jgi:hypothetical protein